jgi:hypothetical protein
MKHFAKSELVQHDKPITVISRLDDQEQFLFKYKIAVERLVKAINGIIEK